jgi:hypothetical protein
MIKIAQIAGIMPAEVAVLGAIDECAYRINPARIGQAGEPFLHRCPNYRE